MIYLDSRIGSRDLEPLLSNLRVPCQLTTLTYADIWFGGCGPRGLSRFAYERKRIGDALQCMQDGRLTGHQLPGMWGEYEHVTLIFEGQIARDPATNVMLEFSDKRRRWERITLKGEFFMWQSWENWLNIMGLAYPGLMFKYTLSPEDTARYLAGTYQHLQADWANHSTHKVIYRAPPPVVLDARPSVFRQVAAVLPGIGWERSAALECRFRSVREMANSALADWLKPKIPGVGKVTAIKAIEALTRETAATDLMED